MALGSGRRYRRWALQRAGLKAGMTVLDVAIGTGLVAREARRIVGPPGDVVGVDVSFGMLARAAASVPVSVVQGRGEQLPFRGASFDFLSLGYALRHLDDLSSTFAEFFRVLKPPRAEARGSSPRGRVLCAVHPLAPRPAALPPRS